MYTFGFEEFKYFLSSITESGEQTNKCFILYQWFSNGGCCVLHLSNGCLEMSADILM